MLLTPTLNLHGTVPKFSSVCCTFVEKLWKSNKDQTGKSRLIKKKDNRKKFALTIQALELRQKLKTKALECLR